MHKISAVLVQCKYLVIVGYILSFSFSQILYLYPYNICYLLVHTKTGFLLVQDIWSAALHCLNIECGLYLNGFVISGNNFTTWSCASEVWRRLGQGIREVSVRFDCGEVSVPSAAHCPRSVLLHLLHDPGGGHHPVAPGGCGRVLVPSQRRQHQVTSDNESFCILTPVIRIRTLTQDGHYSTLILGQLSRGHKNVRQQFLVPRDTYFKADLEVCTSIYFFNLRETDPSAWVWQRAWLRPGVLRVCARVLLVSVLRRLGHGAGGPVPAPHPAPAAVTGLFLIYVLCIVFYPSSNISKYSPCIRHRVRCAWLQGNGVMSSAVSVSASGDLGLTLLTLLSCVDSIAVRTQARAQAAVIKVLLVTSGSIQSLLTNGRHQY